MAPRERGPRIIPRQILPATLINPLRGKEISSQGHGQRPKGRASVTAYRTPLQTSRPQVNTHKRLPARARPPTNARQERPVHPSGSGILTGFPFDPGLAYVLTISQGFPRKTRLPLLAWLTGFPRLLGSANPCPIAVDMEPFSTFGLQAEDFT